LGEAPVNDSKGCGTVMRVAPVGFFAPRGYENYDLFTLGCVAGLITHGHPSGYLSSGAFAYLLKLIREGDPLREALPRVEARLAEEPDHEEVLEALRAARELERSGPEPTPETVEALGGGWVAEETLAIAIYCALAAERSQEPWKYGTLLAINHSGDSDSTGAVAGNLLGAIYGQGGVPAEWVAEVALIEVVSQVADDFSAAVGPAPTEDCKSRDWTERYPPN
jgi:ADP-ribosyl-[dinitrogen reductase] hydrolase